MSDERDSATSTVVLAFLTGAAIGAIAALMLAPQSGEQTQRHLRGYARKAGKELRGAAGKAGDTWDDVIEQGRDFLESKKPILAQAFEAGRKAIQRERDRVTGKKRK